MPGLTSCSSFCIANKCNHVSFKNSVESNLHLKTHIFVIFYELHSLKIPRIIVMLDRMNIFSFSKQLN